MNNYGELPAPNITAFFFKYINKDLIIKLYWRIFAALINLAEKNKSPVASSNEESVPWICVKMGATGGQASHHQKRPATVPYHTQEGHNFFR